MFKNGQDPDQRLEVPYLKLIAFISYNGSINTFAWGRVHAMGAESLLYRTVKFHNLERL